MQDRFGRRYNSDINYQNRFPRHESHESPSSRKKYDNYSPDNSYLREEIMEKPGRTSMDSMDRLYTPYYPAHGYKNQTLDISDQQLPLWGPSKEDYFEPSNRPYHHPYPHGQSQTSSHESHISEDRPPRKILRQDDQEQKTSTSPILDHFGLFPNIPTINLIKLFAIISLIALVELNILMNLGSDKFLGDYIIPQINILFGISLIGLFLAILFRYFEFEYELYNQHQIRYGKAGWKSSFKVFFLIILIIFIIIEVIIELINARGTLFIIDLLGILILFFGTYTIFSGKRYFNIFALIFLFILMIIGIDYQIDLPMMLFLGVLTLIYIELSDGGCRLQEYSQKFQKMSEDVSGKLKIELDIHMDEITIRFVQNLGIFIGLTVLITGLLVGLLFTYLYLSPGFISENLELQSVYAIMPLVLLLFIIFLIFYLISPQTRVGNNKT